MKLEIGYNHPFELRHGRVAGAVSVDVLFLSDLHFNRHSEKTARALSEKINELKPDIILLGGDYVDSRKGLIWLSLLLGAINNCPHILAIPGNHDRYFWAGKIKEAMLANNATWLDNASALLNIGGKTVRIDGGKPATGKPIADLSILLVHKPVDFYPHKNQYHLIFAGHLHGCQFVFWKNEKGLFPGRLFYRWNLLKKHQDNCLYLISKGLGDTLPLRYNCKKDIILVSVSATIDAGTPNI